MSRISKRTLVIYWLPVILMVCIMMIESTEFLDSSHTGRILYPIANWFSWKILGHKISHHLFDTLNFALRKLGHLTGYGLLCGLTFRAVRGTARASQRLHDAGRDWFWADTWAGLALLLTAVIASADEIHQALLPTRTAAFHDVVLDMSGALIAIAIVYFASRRGLKREPVTP